VSDKFWTVARKRSAMHKAEDAGLIADSMDVRLALLKKIESGELAPEDAQAALAKIKRDAKRNGKITRQQAYSRGG